VCQEDAMGVVPLFPSKEDVKRGHRTTMMVVTLRGSNWRGGLSVVVIARSCIECRGHSESVSQKRVTRHCCRRQQLFRCCGTA
jgi:hypothetical protein